MNVVYELCCQWLLLQNNSKRTSLVDFIEVRLFALILFLIYKYIKHLHRPPFLKLLSLRLSKSVTLSQHLFFSFACSLIFQVPSPLRLTHWLSVLCSFSSSFADFSFPRILRMKFFSPWLLIPLSYFRWRGRLPSWCPASRLGWFQLLSPLCNALLIDS